MPRWREGQRRGYDCEGGRARGESTSDCDEAIEREHISVSSLKRLVAQFKKSSAFDLFRTKIGTYQYTVRRLAAARRFDMIEEILEEKKKYRDISMEGFAVGIISL
ncbi:hypothetical protein BT93_L3055 [Corymbia citriodora subsp. variegata]|uniref:Uncharacterized protein n=1 Tax=Corymbia citriodora subsp. variegata TaxID=360336 RepID=A0A8T0CJF6_CORYI|nr:hypothetical protein BT93_L3055 [Corymbia citriodora subsp. variegata]